MNTLDDILGQQQRIQLRQLLTERFSDEELHTLCFDLGIAYDDLAGQGRAAKVRELLDYLDRHAQFSQLAEIGPKVRPDIAWTSVLSSGGSATGSPYPLEKTVPHNLPPRSEFVGRGTEKAQVHAALSSRSYLIEIDGIGGIGKTSLALEAAYDCLRASRDENPNNDMATFEGFIWTTARDRDLSLNAILDTIARTLDYPGIVQQPAEEKRMAIRKLLQAKPHLLVIDNFETITDAGIRDFLLDLPEPSKALITTREQTLRQVRAISIKGLTESEALSLIRNEGRRLGLGSLEQAEDKTLLRLYQATGGAPLAIKWAVGQIKQKGQSLDSILAALHQARGDIFEQVFARSWELLSADARQVLKVMPLFAAPALRAALEAASDVHHFALDDALGQLVETSLVDAADELDQVRLRYSVHPLTRAFAASRLAQEPQVEMLAGQRLAEYIEEFTRRDEPFWAGRHDRVEPDLPTILAVIRWCWAHEMVTLGTSISANVDGLMSSRGYWDDLLALSEQLVAHATDLKDELAVAKLYIWPFGWVHRHRGDLQKSETYVRHALTIFERLGDEKEASNAQRHLGRIAYARGDIEEAERWYQQVLAYFQTRDKDDHYINLVSNFAEVALARGDLDTAWALSHDTLEAAQQMKDPARIAGLFSIMSRVARQRGRLDEAEEYINKALEEMAHAKRLDVTANAYVDLARIEIDRKQEQAAREHLSHALQMYRRLAANLEIRKVEELLAKLSEPTH